MMTTDRLRLVGATARPERHRRDDGHHDQGASGRYYSDWQLCRTAAAASLTGASPTGSVPAPFRGSRAVTVEAAVGVARPVTIRARLVAGLPATGLVAVIRAPVAGAVAGRSLATGPVRVLVRVGPVLGLPVAPGWRRRRRGRNRRRRQRGHESAGKLTWSHHWRAALARLQLHGPAGEVGEGHRYPGDHLARAARFSVSDRRRRQR